MDVRNQKPSEREAERMQAHREELVERIARAMPEDRITQPLQGLHLNRRSSPEASLPEALEKLPRCGHQEDYESL